METSEQLKPTYTVAARLEESSVQHRPAGDEAPAPWRNQGGSCPRFWQLESGPADVEADSSLTPAPVQTCCPRHFLYMWNESEPRAEVLDRSDPGSFHHMCLRWSLAAVTL